MKLVFGVHNHQPVGNFNHVIADVYAHSYLPFLERLELYPQVRLCMHHTGPLWEWLEANHPDYLDRIAGLVRAGRVEPLGGAFYEPILPMIPESDRIGQIEWMARMVQQRLGAQARGMWLAERVWEPHVAGSLAQAGVEFVLLDDFHFIQSGLDPDELTCGPLLTEELGASVALFPISERLRYLIPFREPEETVAACREIHERDPDGMLVMVDDGEKFGGWPDTYDWVYGRRWLDRFFEALSRESSWLQMATPSEALTARPPVRTVYVPPCSYFEMTEWALPVPAAERFGDLMVDFQQQNGWERLRPFLRGALWRQFLQRYSESNLMYRRALLLHHDISQVGGAGAEDAIMTARRELWQAQCNCAYWHGVFGGLYLPHLRHAIYEHLIKGSVAVNAVRPAPSLQAVSVMGAASWDLRIRNRSLDLFIAPANGAACVGMEHQARAWNLQNTLQRRREAYHRKIESSSRNGHSQGSDHDSIHDRSYTVSPELLDALSVDSCGRFSWLDRLIHAGTDLTEKLPDMTAIDAGDFAAAPYALVWPERPLIRRQTDPAGWSEPDRSEVVCERHGIYRDPHGAEVPLTITKTIRLHPEAPSVEISWRLHNRSDRPVEFRFASEWNLALLADQTLLAGESGAATRPRDGSYGSREQFGLHLPHLDTQLSWRFAAACEICIYEVRTVSQSESGYEQQYQGHMILPLWDVQLSPGRQASCGLTFELSEPAGPAPEETR